MSAGTHKKDITNLTPTLSNENSKKSLHAQPKNVVGVSSNEYLPQKQSNNKLNIY